MDKETIMSFKKMTDSELLSKMTGLDERDCRKMVPLLHSKDLDSFIVETKNFGLDNNKLNTILASFEMYDRTSVNRKKITSAEDVYNKLCQYQDADREHFIVIGLDGASRIVYIEVVHIGTLNQSLVHPREVYKKAVREGVAGVIIAHNHPSGQLKPSTADTRVTERLQESSKLLGIELLDHVIITEEGYYSFIEEGVL